MSRQALGFQHIAFFTLFFGAIGDWLSTRIGLSLGFTEGNRIAAFLMSKGAWIQTDLLFVGICFTTPFLLNQFLDNRAPKKLYFFPILAGILKLCVFLWNITVII